MAFELSSLPYDHGALADRSMSYVASGARRMIGVETNPQLPLRAALRPQAFGRTYRDAMAATAENVRLMTATLGAERVGRTVTSVLSLSADPPIVLASIDATSSLADTVRRTEGFSLAVLSRSQAAIADAFAGKVAAGRRFDTGDWTAWKSGHPKLRGAVAVMDCELVGTMLAGDHLLFAGCVVDIELEAESEPLVWHNRTYAGLTGRDADDRAFPAPALVAGAGR